MKLLKATLFKLFPVFILIIVALLFFYKFFLYKLIPMPTDIIVGMYYPWLDQNWGLSTNVPVKNPLMSDIVSIVYQWRIMAIDSIKQGVFPFWNKQYFLGMPLFANFQNSLFNFTNLPFFLTQNNGIAWTWMLLFQLMFSLLSSYYCFIVLKFKKISSIIASVVYSFSLFTIVWFEYGVHTYVAAFLPLLIVCIEKYKESKKRKFLVFFSLLIALQFYGGYPQYSIYSLIFSGLYFIIFVDQKFISKLLNLAIHYSLALFLTAPLLIPGFELISRSIHNIDVTASDITKGFLPFKHFLTFSVPNFWGNPATYDYQGLGFYDNNAIFPGTIALIALVFVFILFLQKKLPKKIKFFLITIICSFLIAVKNPFSTFLKDNLGIIFSGNGISTRIFLLANLSFAIITAYFIDNLSKITKKINILISLILVFAWQLILLLFSRFNLFIFSPVSLKNTLYSLSLLFLFSLTLIFLTILKTQKIKIIFLILIFILTLSESFYLSFKYLPFTKSEHLFPNNPSIEYLQNNSGSYRISTTNTIPANMWTPYGLSSPDGSDATLPLLNFEYFSLLQKNNFSSTGQRALTIDNHKSNLYQNLSVKYLLRQKKIYFDDPDQQFTTVFDQKNTVIQQNKNLLPKVRFVDKIIFLSDKNDFKQKYQSLNFSDSAVLYFQDKNDFPLYQECLSTNNKIDLIEDKNNTLIFNTNNNCDRLVFISNSYFPGWQGFIDNQKSKIYQTNHMFQSIFVPAGQHQIRLIYKPSYFNFAVLLAIFSSITLTIIYLYDRKK